MITIVQVSETFKWIDPLLYLVKVRDLIWKKHIDQLKCFDNNLKSSQYPYKISSELADLGSYTDLFNANPYKREVEH